MSARYPSLQESCLDQLYERDRQLLESQAGRDFNECELSLGFSINRNKYLSCENERLVDELNRLRNVVPMAQVRSSRQQSAPRVQNSCVENCFRTNNSNGLENFASAIMNVTGSDVVTALQFVATLATREIVL